MYVIGAADGNFEKLIEFSIFQKHLAWVLYFGKATGLGSLFWGGARAGQVLYFILKVLYFLGKNRPEFSISEFSIEKKKCIARRRKIKQ
jgi:hypothetical protein